MTSVPDDVSVIRRMQAGDKAALSELWDRYGSLMYGTALHILRSASDAEDALQEAWLQIWRRSASFDPGRGSVAAWLVTVARTRALDRWRRRSVLGRFESDLETEPVDPPPSPEENAMQTELRDRLRTALDALDANQRRVLEIAYFEGLSQSEIAQRLGIPLGTVKYWTRQGLLRLSELVPKDGPA